MNSYSAAAAAGQYETQSPRLPTILVIDDDEALRDTVSLMLEKEGFKTVLVGEGRSGFEQAGRCKAPAMLFPCRSGRRCLVGDASMRPLR